MVGVGSAGLYRNVAGGAEDAGEVAAEAAAGLQVEGVPDGRRRPIRQVAPARTGDEDTHGVGPRCGRRAPQVGVQPVQ